MILATDLNHFFQSDSLLYCVDSIGASFAIDQYETKMFPDYPTEKAPQEYTSPEKGLFSIMADFTVADVTTPRQVAPMKWTPGGSEEKIQIKFKHDKRVRNQKTIILRELNTRFSCRIMFCLIVNSGITITCIGTPLAVNMTGELQPKASPFVSVII